MMANVCPTHLQDTGCRQEDDEQADCHVKVKGENGKLGQGDDDRGHVR